MNRILVLLAFALLALATTACRSQGFTSIAPFGGVPMSMGGPSPSEEVKNGPTWSSGFREDLPANTRCQAVFIGSSAGYSIQWGELWAEGGGPASILPDAPTGLAHCPADPTHPTFPTQRVLHFDPWRYLYTSGGWGERGRSDFKLQNLKNPKEPWRFEPKGDWILWCEDGGDRDYNDFVVRIIWTP